MEQIIDNVGIMSLNSNIPTETIIVDENGIRKKVTKKYRTVSEYCCKHTGCPESFSDTKTMNSHAKSCKHKPIIPKCLWYVYSHRRCKFNGLHNGYCTIHNFDYIFKPGGFIDAENQLEPCSHSGVRKYTPSSIKILNDFILCSLVYIWRGNKYTIVEVRDTYAIMKLKDDIPDIINVWGSRESRKNNKGPIIDQIYAFKEFECENRACVCIDNKYLCKECFETTHNTIINSLKPTD